MLSETYVHMWDAAYDGASGVTMVDDNARGTGLNKWNYVGASTAVWRQSNSAELFNTTNSYENVAGKYATFTFQGTNIQLYFVQDPLHGIAAVSLNGGPESMVDLYSITRKAYRQLWAASNLAPGVNHTVKVRVTGAKNAKARDTFVALDAAMVSNAVCTPEPDGSFCTRLGKNCGSISGVDNCGASRTVAFCGSCSSPQTCGGSGQDNVCGNGEVVDDMIAGTATNQFEYSSGGGWDSCYRCGNGSLYNSSRSQSKTSGAFAKFRFTGVKVKLYGTKAPNHGVGAVSIDDGAESSVDFYNSTVIGDQLLWNSPLLSYGSHTLKLRVTGSKSGNASDFFVVTDRVAISTSATCTSESNATFCARLARNCGTVSGTDNCGVARTVSSCGSCAGEQTCESGLCAASASNLFTNPSFTGGTAGWTTWFASGCGGNFASTTTAQDGDGKGARVSIGSYSNPAWDRVQIMQIKTANGSPYSLRANFQKAEGTSKQVTVFCSENGGSYTLYGSTVCTNSSGWTTCWSPATRPRASRSSSASPRAPTMSTPSSTT